MMMPKTKKKKKKKSSKRKEDKKEKNGKHDPKVSRNCHFSCICILCIILLRVPCAAHCSLRSKHTHTHTHAQKYAIWPAECL